MMKAQVRAWLAEQIGEDEELLQSLYAEYVSALTELFAKAKGEIAAGDYVALNKTAHTLKGSTSTVGDTEMFDAVLVLRDAAKASDGAGAVAALTRLESLKAAL